MKKLSVLVVFLFFVSGCQPTINTSGNICEADDLNSLKIGVHRADDVYEILGTPSFKLEGNRVLYLGRKLKSVAFFKPKITDEKAVLVTFDKGGILESWKIVKLNSKKISFDSNATPVKGTGRTSTDHILDNFQKKMGKR